MGTTILTREVHVSRKLKVPSANMHRLVRRRTLTEWKALRTLFLKTPKTIDTGAGHWVFQGYGKQRKWVPSGLQQNPEHQRIVKLMLEKKEILKQLQEVM